MLYKNKTVLRRFCVAYTQNNNNNILYRSILFILFYYFVTSGFQYNNIKYYTITSYYFELSQRKKYIPDSIIIYIIIYSDVKTE